MKIMHLPGAYILLISGFFVGSVVSFIDGQIKTKRIKELEAQLKTKAD